MIPKSGHRFSEKIRLQKLERETAPASLLLSLLRLKTGFHLS